MSRITAKGDATRARSLGAHSALSPRARDQGASSTMTSTTHLSSLAALLVLLQTAWPSDASAPAPVPTQSQECSAIRQRYKHHDCCGVTEPVPCTCPDEVAGQTVCCDGVEYASPCRAVKCAGCSTYSKGPCEAGCICTKEYAPVCCDGVTYGNKCTAFCAGCQSYVPGECGDGGCICTREWAPVCCDGVTYGNECTARCAHCPVADQVSGECPSPPPTPTPPPSPPSQTPCHAGCRRWFDGCNTCSCRDGEIAACTKMYCLNYATAACREYEYEPCEGKSVNDTCTLCSPQDPSCVETTVVKVCNAQLECVHRSG